MTEIHQLPQEPRDDALPVYSIEAEQQLLGALMLNPERIDKVRRYDAEIFYDPFHQQTWKAMLAKAGRDELVSPVTMTAEPSLQEGLKELGRSYFARLAGGSISSSEVEHYAEFLNGLWQRRYAMDVVGRAHQALVRGETDPAGVVADLEAGLMGMETMDEDRRPVSMLAAITKALETASAGYQGLEQPAVSSGIPSLDAMNLRFYSGDLVLLGGRPSMGKSAIALAMALNAASAGHGVVYASLEMTPEQLVMRALSSGTSDVGQSVPFTDIRTGNFSEDQYRLLGAVSRSMVEMPIQFLPTHFRDPGALYAGTKQALKWLPEDKMPLVIVDYLQLLRSSAKGRYEQMTEISIALKGMAMTLGVPVVALAQLSRAVETRENKRPQLSDLRECLPADARLIDADTGDRVSIANVRPGQRVLSMDEKTQRIVPGSVKAAWTTGRKRVFKVVLRSGRSVRATANHPFFTEHGWRRLEDIIPGDDVATHMGGVVPGRQDDGLSPDLCFLLGLMVGDGTYQELRAVGYAANAADRDMVEFFKATISRHFPECHFRDVDKGNAIETFVSRVFENGHGRPGGNPFREWLRSLGIYGERDHEKVVPGAVFRSGRDGMAAFVSGYLNADGTVKVAAGKTLRVCFSSVSKELLEDVRTILDVLGVASGFVKPETDGRSEARPLHTLLVSSHAEVLRRFSDEIWDFGRKAKRLKEMPKDIAEHGPGALALPRSLSARLAAETRTAGWHWTETWRDQGKRMRRSTARELANRLGREDIKAWADSDLRWDEVVSISPDGHEDVYDITVEGTHSFIANGIVAHNSGQLEQDADSVLFCYRDEYYLEREKPEEDDLEAMAVWQDAMERARNRLELIVGKQRSGPIGTAHLRFNPATNTIWE